MTKWRRREDNPLHPHVIFHEDGKDSIDSNDSVMSEGKKRAFARHLEENSYGLLEGDDGRTVPFAEIAAPKRRSMCEGSVPWNFTCPRAREWYRRFLTERAKWRRWNQTTIQGSQHSQDINLLSVVGTMCRATRSPLRGERDEKVSIPA